MSRAILGVGAVAMLALFGAGCSNETGAATCDPACPVAGYECCASGDDAICRNTFNDANNCGGCGIACASGRCSSGVCMAASDGGVIPGDGSVPPVGDCRPECGSSNQCCRDAASGASRCISRNVAPGADGRTDPSFSNCNTCGNACAPEFASACSIAPGATTPSCRCGIAPSCTGGQTCVNNGGTFSCVSTATDPNNCGTVGNRCAMGESCTSGVCGCAGTGGSCATGEACCPGVGCLDTQSDEMNCGGCGTVCGAGETCTAGACMCGTSPACERAGSGSGGIPIPTCGQICCDDECIDHTATDCGTCGTACVGEEICGTPFAGIPGMGMGGGAPRCGVSEGTSFLIECGGFGFPGIP